MLNDPQRFDDPLGTMRIALDGALSGIRATAPGIIVAFNAATMTATVQPALKRSITAEDGSVSYRDAGLLGDVPVIFPGGGGCVLTFPVAEGDECIICYAAKGIDGWAEYGGTREPFPDRRHHPSDAFILVGLRSRPRALSPSSSTSAAQLRSDDGSVYIELSAGKPVQIVAPQGLHIVGPVTTTDTITASGDVIGQGISLASHVHSGVQPGNGSSGKPLA